MIAFLWESLVVNSCFSDEAKLQDSAVFFSFLWALSCGLLSETLELSNKQDRRGGSAFPGVQCTTSHPSCRSGAGALAVEAGAVAGQWTAPLWLCCPLVNDRAAGSESFVYAVIKHSKPPGWQQAHSLAPGHSAENKTHLMLCFPAPRDPTPEESLCPPSIKNTRLCTRTLS